jgi:hypothetical protein
MIISKYKTQDYDMEKDLAGFEEMFRVNLPADYRSFMGKYNGGDTPNTSFVLPKANYEIKAFYGLKTGRYNLHKDIDITPFVKKEFLPIAFDSFGNLFLIGLKGANYGKVYFCDHEEGNKTIEIADSFVSFILGCVSKEISPNSYKTVEEREAILVAKGRGNIITDNLRHTWQNEIDFFKSLVLEEVEV